MEKATETRSSWRSQIPSRFQQTLIPNVYLRSDIQHSLSGRRLRDALLDQLNRCLTFELHLVLRFFKERHLNLVLNSQRPKLGIQKFQARIGHVHPVLIGRFENNFNGTGIFFKYT